MVLIPWLHPFTGGAGAKRLRGDLYPKSPSALRAPSPRKAGEGKRNNNIRFEIAEVRSKFSEIFNRTLNL